MRKIVLAASVALAGSAAAAKPTSLEQRENAVWQSVKAQQIDRFAANLAPNYVAVYESGVLDRAGEISSVRGQKIESFNISNFRARPIDRGEDVLVTYKIDVRGSKGATVYSGRYWATSLWHRSGSAWSLVYHSDVPAK